MKRYSLRRARELVQLLLALSLVFGAVFSSPATAETGRNYIFLIDLSGSMRGQKLIEAKRALDTVIRSDDLQGSISIVGFNSTSKVILEPTEDKTLATSAVAGLTAGGYTALYDGIVQGLDIAARSKNSVIISITDGNDTSSKSTVAQVADRVAASGSNIFFISIGNSRSLIGNLTKIAGDNGTVLDVTEISSLLESLRPLVVAPSTELQITQGSGELTKTDFLGWFTLLVVSIFFTLIVIPFLYRSRRFHKKQIALLQAYDDEATKNRMFQERSLFYQLMRIKPFNDYVRNEEKRLLAAGIALNVRSWIYTQIAVFVLVNLLLQILGFAPIFGLILAGFIGFGIGKIYLSSVRAKKASAFAEELPDTLTILASSLKSGLSFTQALESVAREGDGEVALQFRRVLSEVQVGRLLTDALQDVADRMDSNDFRWTISALSIQRDVGGNLSDILTTTAETIRGRAEIRREIKALSAEGRMSAYVLVALPILMMLYLQLTRPENLRLMFTQPIGIALMVLVVILIITGWIWVKKVVEVKLS